MINFPIFKNVLRFLRKLDHESIVNFLDVKMTPTHLNIVQELMDTDLDCVFDNFPDGLGAEHTHLFSYQERLKNVFGTK